jgi:hypothetical protein
MQMQQESQRLYTKALRKYRRLSRRLNEALEQGFLLPARRLERRVRRLVERLRELSAGLRAQVLAGLLTGLVLSGRLQAGNQTLTEAMTHQNPLAQLPFLGETGTFADVRNTGLQDLVMGRNGGTLFYFKNVGSSGNPSFVSVTDSSSPFYSVSGGGSYVAPVFVNLRNLGAGYAPDLVTLRTREVPEARPIPRTRALIPLAS